MKKKTLSTIVGSLAVVLLSGGFTVAGEYFHLQQPDRDSGDPAPRGLTVRGDIRDLSQGDDDRVQGGRGGSPGGRVLSGRRATRRMVQARPHLKSVFGVIFTRNFPGSGPRTACVIAPRGGRALCITL